MKLFCKLFFIGILFLIFSCNNKTPEVNAEILTQTTKKFLFDASKGETAGNADWILDWDNSPGRFPTPNQSNITSSTPESYWNGALSSWGIGLVKLGHTVESLPPNEQITFGKNTLQDLKNYDVFVVVEPNINFTDTEKTAILNFVKNGGGLFMISNHNGSDRNHDGYDSVRIWNDFMYNNSVQQNPFGFTFNLTTFSETSSNILSSKNNPILNGSQGKVRQLKYSAGTSISIITTANTTQGLIWRNNSNKGYQNIMCASAIFGKGRVVVIGDSSPADDGTGNPNDKLYYGWTELASHSILHLNASLWLAKL